MISDETAAATQAAQAAPLLGGFARGVGWTYLSLLSSGGAALFLAAWSIRRVGPAQYGLFALVASLAGLVMICDYAMGLAVVRASARVQATDSAVEAEEQRGAVHAAHAGFVALGGAGVLLSLLAVAVLAVTGAGNRAYLLPTVLLMGLATSVELGTAALGAVAQGCRQFSVRSAATGAGVATRVAVALLSVGRFGVAGLAAAQLLGVVVERLVAARLLRRRVPWLVVVPRRLERDSLRRITGFAMPLLVINASGQLFAVSDFVAVGVFVGSSAVGLYNVSSMLPLYALAVLAVGYDVIFPSLAGTADRAGQEAATAFLTRLFGYVAGIGFVLAALMRRDVIIVVLGRASGLGERVLLLFCAVCLANIFVHGPAALLIARGRQRAMARAVAVELPVNLVLTVGFVVAFGAAGAALATLATVLLMDFVIFPVVSRDDFAEPALAMALRHGLAPAMPAAVVALAAMSLGTVASTPAVRLLVGGVTAALLGVALGLVLLRPAGRRTLRDAFARAAPAVAPGPGLPAL